MAQSMKYLLYKHKESKMNTERAGDTGLVLVKSSWAPSLLCFPASIEEYIPLHVLPLRKFRHHLEKMR